jgi:NAD(P)-dependent dehydrogenase (short-subunit alcohol dehydrogenase family)
MNARQAFSLEGKHVLVSGASSGIGRECAIRIAEMGGTVVMTARRADKLEEVRQSLPGSGHACIPGDIWELVQSGRLTAALPELDGVVHSAGFTRLLPVRALTEKFLREIAQVNYEAPVLLSQQMLRARKIKAGGSVVFIASIAARIATRGNAAYSGLKAGLGSFARVMALECSGQKIRVNTVSPGQVKTPIMATDTGPVSADMFAEYEKLYPLGFGDAKDVAHGVIFLLADASSWITGTDMVMDGGFLLA